jgi:hypothetical protein
MMKDILSLETSLKTGDVSRIPPEGGSPSCSGGSRRRRRRSISCHRSLFPFSLFLSSCFHLFLVGVLGWVLFSSICPLVFVRASWFVTFGDVSGLFWVFAVQCL